jgi:hypothetical protein
VIDSEVTLGAHVKVSLDGTSFIPFVRGSAFGESVSASLFSPDS